VKHFHFVKELPARGSQCISVLFIPDCTHRSNKNWHCFQALFGWSKVGTQPLVVVQIFALQQAQPKERKTDLLLWSIPPLTPCLLICNG
jgi:hypothetical protein